MSPPSNGASIRVAIALGVLRFKPTDVSLHAYILDWRSHFPRECSFFAENSWRTYALELEGRQKRLDDIRLFDSRHSVQRVTPTLQCKQQKFGKKLNTVSDCQKLHINPPVDSGLPTSPLNTLQWALELLDPLSAPKNMPTSTVYSATTRALSAISKLLHQHLPPHQSVASLDYLATISSLLATLLSVALPPLLRQRSHSYLKDILSSLAAHICVPILHAYEPLSQLSIAKALSHPNQEIGSSSVSHSLVSMLYSIFSTMESATSDTHVNYLKSILTREAIELIDRLQLEFKAEPTKQEAQMTLAAKDSAWFLCTTLHLIIHSTALDDLHAKCCFASLSHIQTFTSATLETMKLSTDCIVHSLLLKATQ